MNQPNVGSDLPPDRRRRFRWRPCTLAPRPPRVVDGVCYDSLRTVGPGGMKIRRLTLLDDDGNVLAADVDIRCLEECREDEALR